MKRYGKLFEKICSMDNIRLAHENAKRRKGHYRDVRAVNSRPDEHFSEIKRLLESKTYRTAPYVQIVKREYGKDRVIHKLPYFPDRIVHHAIVQVVGPIWDKTLIRDTYACIKGRGIHDGVRRMKQALKDVPGTQYCLKMDVRKFYPSLDHAILKAIIRKKIKDQDVLDLLNEIIESLSPGVPIGNYLSQFFGNLYLSDFDHSMKEAERCRYYFRYCDDIVVLYAEKKRLHELRGMAQEYFEKRLNVGLKDNWQVFPVDARGIDFLGYRFFHGYTLLRKTISSKFKRKMLVIKAAWPGMRPVAVASSIMSYNGWMRHADCHNLKRRHIDSQISEILVAALAGMKPTRADETIHPD